MAGQRKNQTSKYIIFKADPESCSDGTFEAVSNGSYNNLESAYGAIMADVISIHGFNRTFNNNDIDISLPMQLSDKSYKIYVYEAIPKYGPNIENNILSSYYILATNNTKGVNEECE